MRDRQLREIKERLFTPPADMIGQRLHPTTITLIGAAVGVGAAAAAWGAAYGLGLLLWVINRALDGLDGTVARRAGRQSDLGGYVDLLVDFLVYGLIPVGLAASQRDEAVYMAALLLLASFYLNAASWMALAAVLERRGQGAVAVTEKTTITMPGGLIEGAETVGFYVLFFLLPGHLVALFGLMAALVLVTIAQRLVWAIRHL